MAERGRSKQRPHFLHRIRQSRSLRVPAVRRTTDDVGAIVSLCLVWSPSLISRSQLNFDQSDSAVVFFANYHVKAAAWTWEKHYEEVEDVDVVSGALTFDKMIDDLYM